MCVYLGGRGGSLRVCARERERDLEREGAKDSGEERTRRAIQRPWRYQGIGTVLTCACVCVQAGGRAGGCVFECVGGWVCGCR